MLPPPFLFVKKLQREVDIGDDFPAALPDCRSQDSLLELEGGLFAHPQEFADAVEAIDEAATGLLGFTGLLATASVGDGLLYYLFQMLEELSL